MKKWSGKMADKCVCGKPVDEDFLEIGLCSVCLDHRSECDSPGLCSDCKRIEAYVYSRQAVSVETTVEVFAHEKFEKSIQAYGGKQIQRTKTGSDGYRYKLEFPNSDKASEFIKVWGI
jgi:hypothetical protein